MLFNSFEFILGFLPLALAGYLTLVRVHRVAAAFRFLLLASLLFYAWWNPPFLLLLLASIGLNFLVVKAMTARREGGHSTGPLLGLGIVLNLSTLGWFKYAGFAVANLDRFFGLDLTVPALVLPLGISFFTFQQIAYLVDLHHAKLGPVSFRNYALFVTFFPHLIAGPLVHHREMISQFSAAGASRITLDLFAWGLTYFVIGLAKKVILADGAATYASPVFNAADAGQPVSLLEAWCGSLAYSFQLYFDFSGYSDMAIGLAAMFGIFLPLNFFSPYRSGSIIEFWRRWHITLSRFLRDYLYIPLGGNRHGPARRQFNLFATMLLGGLWHGANWTFVLWGALHGAYLAINHAWRHACEVRCWTWPQTRVARLAFVGLTFLAVLMAWVLFRAHSVEGAFLLYKAMLGGNGFTLPLAYRPTLNSPGGLGSQLEHLGVEFRQLSAFYGTPELIWLAILSLIAWGLPNTAEFMNYANRVDPSKPTPERSWQFRFSRLSATIVAGLLIYALMSIQSVQKSEFLYYDF